MGALTLYQWLQSQHPLTLLWPTIAAKKHHVVMHVPGIEATTSRSGLILIVLPSCLVLHTHAEAENGTQIVADSTTMVSNYDNPHVQGLQCSTATFSNSSTSTEDDHVCMCACCVWGIDCLCICCLHKYTLLVGDASGNSQNNAIATNSSS